MKDNRVLLGFSGGIDSFAAVGLLQAAGYHVTALTLDMRGDSALLEKARLRAGALGIPWRMRSVRERFEREVVDYFTDSYFRGCTPAPCTRCNSRIKWPCLAAEADALGIRHIATGHYFRITSAGGKRYVTRAADNRKDQSYYLWDLPQEILDRFCQAYSSGFGCSSSKNSGFSRLMNPITSSKPSRNLEKSSL